MNEGGASAHHGHDDEETEGLPGSEQVGSVVLERSLISCLLSI